MKVWLDDERPMPEEFDVHVKTAQEAITLLATADGAVTLISLDHDLGDEHAATGHDVASWIEEEAFKGTLQKFEWRVHTGNTVAYERMYQALENANKYWDKQTNLEERAPCQKQTSK